MSVLGTGSPAAAVERGYKVARVAPKGAVHLYRPNSLVALCNVNRPPRVDLPTDDGTACRPCCRAAFGTPGYVPVPQPLVEVLAETPVEFQSFPVKPSDASDVLAALSFAVEYAEVWLADGGDGTLADRLRLHALLSTLNWSNGRLTAVATAVENSVAADLTEPTDVDGTVWHVDVEFKRSGFDKQALRSAVNARALADIRTVDPETGEVAARRPTPAEAVDTVWKFADVATGRTKVFREAGISLTQHADVATEVARVREFNPLSVPPEDAP